MPLLICRTCPRHGPDSGSFGDELDAAVAAPARARGVRVRHVPCLGGCPSPGNVALDAPGKPRVRFSRVSPGDAGALVEAATGYDASDSDPPGAGRARERHSPRVPRWRAGSRTPRPPAGAHRCARVRTSRTG